MGHHHRLVPKSSSDIAPQAVRPDAQHAEPTNPVVVPLPLLESQSADPIPSQTLLEAFGPSSLGILIVSDLPPYFPALRSRVLSQISRLAHLPSTALDKLTNERAKYLIGWSHGKESLRPGVVDTGKGSYYVNTAFNEKDPVIEAMRKKWQGFEGYTAPNIWPNEEQYEDMQGFRQDVEELITLIVNVAGLVARAVDGFAEQNVENYPKVTKGSDKMGYLEGVVRGSRTSKARLLHYFPSDPSLSPSDISPVSSSEDSNSLNDSWCTTHKDHSCLTGLTSAAFYNESTSPYTELPASPSKTAGLYILSRTSQIHKVSIPKDCLAFQTGEALERITKGKLKAVPHFVRGVEGNEEGKIARSTLAVFTQPNLDDVVDLDEGISFGDFASGIVGRNTT